MVRGPAGARVGLTEEKERLEKELSRLSAAFRKESKTAALTPEQLRQSLPANVALVDFLEYTHQQPDPERKGHWKRERRLTAFVVRADRAIVRLDLGAVQPIAAAIDQWRGTLKRVRPIQGENDSAAQLRRLIWQPLEAHLDGAETVLISPDGCLARLPFAALPGKEEGKYLLEEIGLAVVPVLQLLPEMLTESRPPANEKPSLLLLGDADFDAVPGGDGTVGRTAPSPERGSTRREWKRAGPDARSFTIRDARARLLDGRSRWAGATEAELGQQTAVNVTCIL